MDIVTATRDYEKWMARHINPVRDQITSKHKKMAQDPIQFLRGTFYRWAQVWPEVCKNMAGSTTVLASGDLHVASYGTWRDAFGRLIWGIDDFDEAYRMPYPSDLVRLATSAALDAAESNLSDGIRDICDIILDGYTEGLKTGGRQFVLEERHKWLRQVALNHLDEPLDFWKTLDALPTLKIKIPHAAKQALEKLLPQPGLPYRVARRIAGTGSLGHPRYVLIAEWSGGQIAFEAKAALPSSYIWARSLSKRAILYETVLKSAIRCPDPCVHMDGDWLVRRLAPDSSPIEIESLAKHKEQERLLHAMAWEAANIHLGTKGAAEPILKDLRNRRGGWFRSAVKEMFQVVNKEWKQWKQFYKSRV